MKKVKATNPELIETIRFLRKQGRENKAKIWADIAERLAKPRRQRIAVNLSHLNRSSGKNDTVAVPGKVLGTGTLNHPVTVAAFAFSKRAKEKIKGVRGKSISFLDLVKKNPSGSGVKIVG